MSNNKRSGKFYRNNEREVMEGLGLMPTPNSGSGWIVKEDGESEDIIAQLKSTDANSIKVNKKDIDTLIYHSYVSHKIPLFIIQFLNSNDIYFIIRPEDLQDLSGLIKGIKPIKNTNDILSLEYGSPVGPNDGISNTYNTNNINTPKIKSASNARKSFMEANDKKFKKQSKSAK